MRPILSYDLNFGPQHPAAHGVLRLILEVCGEIVIRADPHIGFLHRGTEKLIETKTFFQALPYFDRLDYVSMMAQEHCFSLAIESLVREGIPKRSSFLRVIFSEITRILNHLMAVTTHALDVGALTPFLWAFEEREKLMCFYEEVSGARMHSIYIRPGGVSAELPFNFLIRLYNFLFLFEGRLSEIQNLLNKNRIWNKRLRGVGIVSKEDACSFGYSGVLLRGSGVSWDSRKDFSYEIYNSLSFKIPVGAVGDCFDRYLIRMLEMSESVQIIFQCIGLVSKGPLIFLDSKISSFSLKNKNFTMEKIIKHFEFFKSGFEIEKGLTYTAVEAPKGEFGVFVKSNNSFLVSRCKIKAPGLLHLCGVGSMIVGHLLADAVTCIGSADVVFGEIDR